MTDLWNQLLRNKTAEEKQWQKMDEEVKQEIQSYKEQYRERFEKEFENKEFPRHPYKIKMQIIKEEGLYGKTHRNHELARALEMLRKEYEETWSEMANA